MTTKKRYHVLKDGGEQIREGVTKFDNSFVFSSNIEDWQRSRKANRTRRPPKNKKATWK